MLANHKPAIITECTDNKQVSKRGEYLLLAHQEDDGGKTC